MKAINGVPQLDMHFSRLEWQLFRELEDLLFERGYEPLSVPTSVPREVIDLQGVIPSDWLTDVLPGQVTTGSAEQGILSYYHNRTIERAQGNPLRLFSTNQCWRLEASFDGWFRCGEFKKTEQFVFCHPSDAQAEFKQLLRNATDFLDRHDLVWRFRDCTEDEGYHLQKTDIEVYTQTRGWMETHSCTYFGEEQTKRFNIGGGCHTLSNTGMASPRILIPFWERSLRTRG